jgi:hypothetical protein
MGKIVNRKTRAEFETADVFFSQGKARPVVITLHATHMELRLKGTRGRETMPYSSAFSRALAGRLAMEKREKIQAKKKKI